MAAIEGSTIPVQSANVSNFTGSPSGLANESRVITSADSQTLLARGNLVN